MKILDPANLFVADSPMKKKKKKNWFPSLYPVNNHQQRRHKNEKVGKEGDKKRYLQSSIVPRVQPSFRGIN